MNDSTPEVSVWRLSQLEGKVDVLADKVDEVHTLLIRTQCPKPGACIDLGAVISRLDKLVAAHDADISTIKTEMVVARSNLRLIVTLASIVGGILGAAVSSVLVKMVSKIGL